jgi:capsular polysaccharide biosynthesis protein
MLQNYSVPSEAAFDRAPSKLSLHEYWNILKRRALLGAVAFAAVIICGFAIIAIQKPVYEATGKVLVESPDVPTNLVEPTVTDTADERIQVIEQRIMTRDNLLALLNKYGMFASERQWLSDTQFVDLMRENTKFELIDLNSAGQPRSEFSPIAFSVTFQYFDPDVTLKVTNDLLTLILDEDARNRTSRAEETTNFLSRESQRLQAVVTGIQAQINELSQSTQSHSDDSDPAQFQAIELAKLKDELAQKSTNYSRAHPYIVSLRRQIAAMEKLIAESTEKASTNGERLAELQAQETMADKNLDDANKKLEQARMGEKLERDREAARLQVIEQPVLPQRPVKPNMIKLFGLSLALALVSGFAVIYLAESLDGSIRYPRELLGMANSQMIISIPYIVTRGEAFRKHTARMLTVAILAALLISGIVWAVVYGPSIDLSWLHEFWLEHLTRLSK